MGKRHREEEEPRPAAQSASADFGHVDSVTAARVPWVRALQASTLPIAGLWIYWSAIRGDWQWDDSILVTGNANLRSLHGLWNIWFSAPVTDYWPMSWTLLWVQWHLWGNQPVGYHVVSLLLHLVSSFLVWRVLSKLGLRWAWLAALLFTIHPLGIESVAWVSEIKNTLSLPFFLLSLSAYIDFERTRARSSYALSISCYLVAMLSKTSVVMLPVVLLLYCWWKRDRVTRKDAVGMIPYLAIALALGIVTLHFQSVRVAVDAAVDSRGLDGRLHRRREGCRLLSWEGPLSVRPASNLPAMAPLGAVAFRPFDRGISARRSWDDLGPAQELGPSRDFVLRLLPAQPPSRARSSKDDLHAHQLGVGSFCLFAYDRSNRAVCARIGGVLSAASSLLESVPPRCNGCPLLPPGLGQPASGGSLAKRGNLVDVHGRSQSRFRDRPFNLATALQEEGPGHLADAIAHFEEALRLKPDFAEAHSNLVAPLRRFPGDWRCDRPV